MEQHIRPGLIPSPVDPRAAQYEAVFELGGPSAPRASRSWREFMPAFRWQHSLPTCASHAQTAVQYGMNLEAGEGRLLCSPINLFVRANGSIGGSRLDSNAEVAATTPILESDKPYPASGVYSADTWAAMRGYALAVPEGAAERGLPARIKSYQWITPTNTAAILDAMEHSPLVLGIQVHRNYFHADAGWTVLPNAPWHAVVGVEYQADGSWLIFDSLTQSAGYDGFHVLPPDYPVGFAMSYRDMPSTWKEDQRTWLERLYPDAYLHYGLPRKPLAEEQAFAFRLKALVEGYPDVGIRAIAARYWIVLVNAALYGGFSYSVEGPGGRRYLAYGANGSDLANCLYHFRRHGSFPLDFNRPRSAQ